MIILIFTIIKITALYIKEFCKYMNKFTLGILFLKNLVLEWILLKKFFYLGKIFDITRFLMKNST